MLNRTPVALDSIPAREIMVDHADTVDVSRFFSDPDGDPLIWAAAVSDGELVAATLSGSTLTLTGLAKGEAVVTITATDDEGLLAQQRFEVTVPNRSPLATDSIPSRTLYKSETDTLDLAAHFADPDGDPLAWAAEASDTAVVALEVFSGSGTLIVTPCPKAKRWSPSPRPTAEPFAADQVFGARFPQGRVSLLVSRAIHPRSPIGGSGPECRRAG